MKKQFVVMLGLFVLALFAIMGTWVHAQSSALSLNGYDWAEWVSLSPSERGGQLLYTGMLRLFLVWITIFSGVLGAHYASKGGVRYALLALTALLCVAQLPPPEFLKALSDVNYQQQAFFTVLSMGLCAMVYFLPAHRLYVFASATTVTLVALPIGMLNSLQIMQGYGLTVSLGIATYIAGLSLVGALLTSIRQLQASR